MAAEPQIDPESLVARMMAELRANPAARELLLRSTLTQEFLGLPARMDAVENRLERVENRLERAENRLERVEERLAGVEDRLTRLEEAVTQLVETVRQLAIDVGYLRGAALETRLHRSVRSRVSQALGLRRARIMQSELLEPLPELAQRLDDAREDGLITSDQDSRVEATDVIMQAERKNDGATIWVAIEASSSIHENDVHRARESADILAVMFDQPAEAAVVGHRINDMDSERAGSARVHVLIVPPVL